MVKQTRKIQGKLWNVLAAKKTKAEARVAKEKLKKKGFLSRVIPVTDNETKSVGFNWLVLYRETRKEKIEIKFEETEWNAELHIYVLLGEVYDSLKDYFYGKFGISEEELGELKRTEKIRIVKGVSVDTDYSIDDYVDVQCFEVRPRFGFKPRWYSCINPLMSSIRKAASERVIVRLIDKYTTMSDIDKLEKYKKNWIEEIKASILELHGEKELKKWKRKYFL
jgi:hypothetical protein